MKAFMLLLLGCLAFSGSSCGLRVHRDLILKDQGFSRLFSSTDPSFASQISSFELTAAAKTGDPTFRIGDIPINFGDPENEQFQGVCFVYSSGEKEIIIRKSWWDGASGLARESLIFHELGHCALNRDHHNETVEALSRFFKTSMMNSVIVGPNDYLQFKDEYHEELFTLSTTSLLGSLGL